MKRYITAAAALALVATASPAFAQDRDDRGYNRDDNSGYNRDRDYNRNDRDDRYRDRDNHRNYDGDPRRHAWHDGDSWKGHRVASRNGRWGYYEPRNGTEFFVEFSL
jgi:hypothetical protein